jgi:sodium/potassium/calcium exchanger 6
MHMYFCQFHNVFGETGKIIAFTPVGVLLMIIFMYALSNTADQYLSPCLSTIVSTFKIPESLAGVTLLALGNGAPDVFSTIAAMGGKDPDGIKAVAIIFGGTFFISCLVVTLTLKASNLNENPTGVPIHKI